MQPGQDWHSLFLNFDLAKFGKAGIEIILEWMKLLLFWNNYFFPPFCFAITDWAEESEPVFIKELGYILNSDCGYYNLMGHTYMNTDCN